MMGSPRISFSCPVGQISKLYDFGLISTVESLNNWCTRDKLADQDCNNVLNDAIITGSYETLCRGKTGCTISDFSGIFKDGASVPKKCTSEDSMFFMQVACQLTDDQLYKQRIAGLYVGCAGVFIALFYIVFIEYVKKTQKNNFVEWDVKTLTAGDYTVEVDIPEAAYKEFLQRHCEPDESQSAATQFRSYMKKFMEEALSAFPNLGFDEGVTDIKIAKLTFAFDNAVLINLLRQRGMAIKGQNFDKVRELNKKIDQYRQDNYDKIARPVSIFLTFSSEEGKQRCIQYNDIVENDPELNERYGVILGHKLDFQEASEPTDIIWENRSITPFQRMLRTIGVCCVVGLILAISFVVIFTLKRINSKLQNKYPSSQCDQIKDQYGKNLMSHAIKDYQVNIDKKNPQYQQFLSCFCIQQKKDLGSKAADKEYYSENAIDPDTGKPYEPAPICKTYYSDRFWGTLVGAAMPLIITGFNMYLMMTLSTLIKKIGEDTHSAQIKSVTNGIFMATFFNTAIVLLLAGSNFHDAKLPFEDIFSGPYNDFIPKWYSDVAYRVFQAMVLNCIMPVVQFGNLFAKLNAFRILDRGFSRDDYKTKKTSIQSYVDLYCGPDYMIQQKYAVILNTSFVIMMYGMGVPSLFFVATASLCTLYFLERLAVAYFYKQPPSFDDKMTKNAVGVLKFAALLYLFFGYWMLSSPQIFQNEVYPKETIAGIQPTAHVPIESMMVDQAIPVFLIGCVMLFITLMQTFAKGLLKSWGFAFGSKTLNVDENLPPFWDAIKFSQAEWLQKENNNLKENYGFKIVDDYVLDELDKSGAAETTIQGVPFYFILANPSYFSAFQYIPCNVPNRNALIIDDDENEENDLEQSDMVSLILNLAFIPEKYRNFC